MKTLEIHYGKSLKINKGSYEQDSPMWNEKITIQLNGETPEQVAEIEKREYELIKNRIDQRAEEEWKKQKLDIIGLRIREKNGKKYPSVTSILKPEPYTGNPEYGLRGTEIHRICNGFLKSGVWAEPEVDLRTLSYTDCKYKEFFEKFKSRIDTKKHLVNLEVFNEPYVYSGEIDLICKVDGLLTLADYKTGGWDWAQLVAYAKSVSYKIQQLAIFDFKTCELHLIAVDSKEATNGWEKFVYKRGCFEGRFGI